MFDGIAMQFPRKVLYYRSPLEPLLRRTVDREILGFLKAHDDTVYGPGPTLVVWTAHLLHQLPFVDQTQWQLLLREASGYLQNAGDQISQAIQPYFVPGNGDFSAAPPLFQIVFVDSRYVSWHYGEPNNFIDLLTGDVAEELQHPGVETIAYNLTELSRRELRRFLSIQNKMESTDARSNISGETPL